MNPFFFSGFVQADGCFHVNIQKSKKAKHGIRLKPTFYLTQLNENNKQISQALLMGKELLKTGYIVADKRNNCSSLCVNTLKGLNESVLPHFEKYPLLSAKSIDYKLFKDIVDNMTLKNHKDYKILHSLIEKANRMNNIGKHRKKHKVNTLVDQCIKNQEAQLNLSIENEETHLNPYFVSGLFQGDGSFGISFNKRINKSNKIITKCSVFFTLGQERISISLLEKIKAFFKKGTLYSIKENHSRWMVNDREVLLKSVLPHFEKYPLIGVKNKNLSVFIKCLQILTLTTQSKKEKQKNIEQVIFLSYNNNMGGKRKRMPKEDYLRAIAS